MTLPKFLKSYSTSNKLKAEYKACDKKALLTNFLNAKQAKESVPTRTSNIAISKAVISKMERVTASVCLFYFLGPFLTPF